MVSMADNGFFVHLFVVVLKASERERKNDKIYTKDFAYARKVLILRREEK